MYSSYGGSGIYRTYGRYQQEEDNEDRSSLAAGSKSSSKKKINEMLAKALREQDEEGEEMRLQRFFLHHLYLNVVWMKEPFQALLKKRSWEATMSWRRLTSKCKIDGH